MSLLTKIEQHHDKLHCDARNAVIGQTQLRTATCGNSFVDVTIKMSNMLNVQPPLYRMKSIGSVSTNRNACSMRCPAAANKAVLDWHTKKRLVAKKNSTPQQRAKLTTSIGSEQAVLFLHVVIGDLLTLQIPTSVIEINESERIQFSERRMIHVHIRANGWYQQTSGGEMQAPERIYSRYQNHLHQYSHDSPEVHL
ncbi:hypothetical protein HBH70_224800 [Parastagonospora nodorum]|nr:hypothetical protein HBH51_224260 [Parastagonospora nodorum]KAH4019658.1 hypothetical protein HBI09_184040 [Parastagonospora nodorum]KAH4043945.1 hypothetical protein HBH49_223330 [Parastagonospora nodorum]KAH4061410.1 hypothetical protein HBH50_220520 [Parastagonospora nodorum]KAH4079855.1 hypothetical protein HBH48_214010 [Parastagonospora nodorum]